MSYQPKPREYFLDSLHASLMLLGIAFHVALIYSNQSWSVNSSHPSLRLTLLNEFIHAFRMQIFFVISGYFSYMLYLRYPPNSWLKIRLQRVGIPLLAAVPLITLPQFFLLENVADKFPHWSATTLHDKYNLLSWALVSHLWFLVILCLFTMTGRYLFAYLTKLTAKWCGKQVCWGEVMGGMLLAVLAWCLLRRLLAFYAPLVMADALTNIVVMPFLFYLPMFLLGTLLWQIPALKTLFVRPYPPLWALSALAFLGYHFVQHFSVGINWYYELDALFSVIVGVGMINICFSLGYRWLNQHSSAVNYLVNASLFVYLVHHPLTLIYGLYLSHLIDNNILGFFAGNLLVFSVSFLLYALHLRIPICVIVSPGKRTLEGKSGAVLLIKNI